MSKYSKNYELYSHYVCTISHSDYGSNLQHYMGNHGFMVLTTQLLIYELAESRTDDQHSLGILDQH